jgi:hypothetical protein
LRSEVSKDRQQTLADAWAQVVIDSRIMADMAKKSFQLPSDLQFQNYE